MSETLFGDKLKELRSRNGWTQRVLAEKAGLAQRTISGLEQNVYEPIWSTAVKIAKALGVDLAAFLEPTEAKPTPRGRGRPPKSDTAATANGQAATARKATQTGRRVRGGKH